VAVNYNSSDIGEDNQHICWEKSQLDKQVGVSVADSIYLYW
jgi:hypothetical protein